MKKYLLMIAAIFSFTFAQAQGLSFGLKGGGNYSTFSGKDVPKSIEYKFGYHIGVVGLYEFDDMFGIKPEILYTTKGAQETFGDGDEEIDSKASLNYISVPILLNVNAGGLFFEFGPEVAYLASVSEELKSKNGKTETRTDKDEMGLASMDFGYVAGLGYKLPMGLNFGIRYNGGIKSIFDSKDREDTNARNSTFMFSVGYMFGGN